MAESLRCYLWHRSGSPFTVILKVIMSTELVADIVSVRVVGPFNDVRYIGDKQSGHSAASI
jgi:hypothetical protein